MRHKLMRLDDEVLPYVDLLFAIMRSKAPDDTDKLIHKKGYILYDVNNCFLPIASVGKVQDLEDILNRPAKDISCNIKRKSVMAGNYIVERVSYIDDDL